MNTHHAVHYASPRPPVLFRFATAADRETWLADHPSFRRAIAAPADQSGYLHGPVSLENGGQIQAEFRVAALDDLFPPVTALRDAMIDRLKGAAVSPLTGFTSTEVSEWAERNGFEGSERAAGVAMEDAASLHLLRP